MTYGIEAFFPALSEMFSEESVTVRVYASPAARDLLVAIHDDMAQEGKVGTVRIGDVLGNIDVVERMGRDIHVNDEYAEIFYRHNPSKQNRRRVQQRRRYQRGVGTRLTAGSVLGG